MTNEADTPPAEKQRGAGGCFSLAGIFLLAFLVGTFATLALYALVVEHWRLIAVRREFGFDMVVYAPLAGLICGFVAAFWSIRGGLSARRTPLLLGLGLIVALVLMLVFFGLGSVL
jgi:hypothetical protein